MNLAQLLVRTARIFPEAPAIFFGRRLVCNYRELAERAARIAGHLRNTLKLSPGDRVAVFMTNNPEYLEVLYGIWYAGLAAVPINAKLHAREAEFIVRDSGATALFVSSDLAAGLMNVSVEDSILRAVFIPGNSSYESLLRTEPIAQAEPSEPDDLAWLFYTSGTTGRPKGVMQSHFNLLAMTMCYFTDVDQVRQDDAIVYAAPMSHGAGLYNFPHVLMGARHVIPDSGGFDPEELVALAAHHRNVSMFAAPTMVKRLVEHVDAVHADATGFKTIVYGGGPMYVEDIRLALAVMGNRFAQIYGQGESPMTITALSKAHLTALDHPRHAERLASVGIAQSLVEVRVADEYGNTLPPDTVGEVMVKGTPVMKGYWNNPEATAQAIRDGWLLTGDMGSMDADGFLTLRDRSKDVIISGGSNIYPREVEEVLLLDPAVHEVSVVGRPDPEWGEVVVAFVSIHAGKQTSAQALDALCLEHIARFKRPKEYRFVDTLPKNNYGKVLKTALRKQLMEEEHEQTA
ncbi:MAG: AMP-binding protein [Burkholderiales bacterium]|nr:AMP-binding protein [Burkholderiales bacterium]